MYTDVLAAYPDITYIEGRARLTGKNGVEIDGKRYAPGKIIIATGARLWAPPIPGLAKVSYLDSASALDLKELPRSMIVLGANAVGLELAQLHLSAELSHPSNVAQDSDSFIRICAQPWHTISYALGHSSSSAGALRTSEAGDGTIQANDGHGGARHQRAQHKEHHMIARLWHGVTPASKADAYLDTLNQTGVRDLRATPGNRGVVVLRRIDGDVAHFLLISLWDSMDAVKRFAGAEVDKARYYPEDHEFLLEFEPTVTHYEVPIRDM